MKKILTVILITLITSNVVFAKAVKLEKEDKAPFTGILIDNSTANKMRVDIEVGEVNKKILLTKEILFRMSEEVLKDREKQVVILENQNNTLSERLYKHRSFSSLEKTTWFILGIVTTGLAVKLAGELHD